ncbi:MAG: thioredoxin family protein [Opitutaceae bacterium]|jgi:thioredoxin 1
MLSFAYGSDKAASSAPQPQRPRLIELGAEKCIPCKMMAPILAELAKEYPDALEVVFIDVWKKRQEGARYGIAVIPTQIFFDANGKELFRHEGFFAKKDILAKWQELGVKLVPVTKADVAGKKS